MDLTAFAALAAAGFSIANVILTARLNSRGHLEQWRRDEERPIIARLLVLSADALRAWQRAAGSHQLGAASRPSQPAKPGDSSEGIDAALGDWEEGREKTGDSTEASAIRDAAFEYWDAGKVLYDKLRFELAQLKLIAGRPICEVVTEIVRMHRDLRSLSRPLGAGSDWRTKFGKRCNELDSLHERLVVLARADLGIDRTPVSHGVRSRLRLLRSRMTKAIGR